MAQVRVKVCGVTSVQDAVACVEAGADYLGLNFWAGSVRRCEVDAAERIVAAVGGRVLLVAVVVDAPLEELRRLREAVGVDLVQLHGHEPPEVLEALLPGAYKALRVADATVIEEARRYGGAHLLLDASVPGLVGGTGRTFDWALAAEVARERRLFLAGGLGPENVAEAVRAVRPFAVDVASGVEARPGVKDPERVRAFVDAARGA